VPWDSLSIPSNQCIPFLIWYYLNCIDCASFMCSHNFELHILINSFSLFQYPIQFHCYQQIWVYISLPRDKSTHTARVIVYVIRSSLYFLLLLQFVQSNLSASVPLFHFTNILTIIAFYVVVMSDAQSMQFKEYCIIHFFFFEYIFNRN
jgi:FlaA1/EpsC-like NDP-sugar epimerase